MNEFKKEPAVNFKKGVDWKPFSGASCGGMKWAGNVKADGVPHGAGRCGYTRRNFVYEGIMVNGVMQGFGRFIY